MTYHGLPSDPPGFDRAMMFGSWFVGMCIEAFFCGMIVLLTIDYFQNAPKNDSRLTKLIVGVGCFLCLVRTIELDALVWHKLVAGWGNYDMAYNFIPWYMKGEGFLNVTIVVICQTFFVTRLQYFLREQWWRYYFLALVGALMMVEYAGFFARAVMACMVHSFLEIKKLNMPDLVGTIGMISVDVLITSSMCLSLYWSRTGVAKTDRLISRLVALSFTTAFIPMADNIIRVAFYRSYYTKSTVYMTFNILQTKLYMLAVLVTLKLRKAIRNEASDTRLTGLAASIAVPNSGLKFAQRNVRSSQMHTYPSGLYTDVSMIDTKNTNISTIPEGEEMSDRHRSTTARDSERESAESVGEKPQSLVGSQAREAVV